MLFFLNKEKVELFRSRFDNALPTGNFRISGLISTIDDAQVGETHIEAFLKLSYLPYKTKLVLSHFTVVERTEDTISSESFDRVELVGENLLKILHNGVSEDFFQSYFIARNTPSNEELPIIKDVVKTYFEQQFENIRVIDVSITPAATGSAHNVAYDKLYKATVKFKRWGDLEEWSGYFGNSNDIWIVPPKKELEKTIHMKEENT